MSVYQYTSVVTMNSAMFSKCIVNKVSFLTMAGTGVLAPAGRMLHWQAIKTSKPQHYNNYYVFLLS